MCMISHMKLVTVRGIHVHTVSVMFFISVHDFFKVSVSAYTAFILQE